MGAIKENVTSQRTIIGFTGAVTASATVLGEAIDTADFEDGVYVSAYLSGWVDGAATVVVKHSDTDTGTFEDIGASNVVYGDGSLPVLTKASIENDAIARGGVVGQKRYIKVGFAGDGDIDTVTGHVFVTLTSELCPIRSDAVHIAKRATLTWSTGVVTATVSGGHGYETGQYITITGASPAGYNGTYKITVTGSTTFTYEHEGTLSTPATGNIYASKEARQYESLTGGA